MALIVRLDTNPAFAPRDSVALPERLIEGAPAFKTWPLDDARDGHVRTGIWSATPGTYTSIKGEAFEFCYILEGHAELTEEGGETHTFRAGDSFVLKPGYRGVWKTIETIRKIYVYVD
ncbi:cupin domain-containing protein [Lichenihabitans sp. Uapishka_5]|uniref:cupin domain-containing protein n=1 Tax=Lichenihabitans sp. Uapishka_5 TaxID=3037302 RepID=UPI0029E7FD01|nr:cupin domain-containing protein [Lichenihabitans sp. Uapishka_5]MDX7950553.1 cupin domain-containing protein [Lichenihabitans sp. Uapishka_5]